MDKLKPYLDEVPESWREVESDNVNSEDSRDPAAAESSNRHGVQSRNNCDRSQGRDTNYQGNIEPVDRPRRTIRVPARFR